MPKQVKARAPQDEREERAVRKLARSQHAPADWIWHARMVVESWAGKTPDQIAADLQCHPQTVRVHVARFNQQGIDGLGVQPGSGRKPRLTADDIERIKAALKRGPEALGYETGLWTAWRVADLIERECGVTYHPGHVWKVLRALGWSCQKPTGRALERNEGAIQRWKKERWPELKKKPRRGDKP